MSFKLFYPGQKTTKSLPHTLICSQTAFIVFSSASEKDPTENSSSELGICKPDWKGTDTPVTILKIVAPRIIKLQATTGSFNFLHLQQNDQKAQKADADWTVSVCCLFDPKIQKKVESN